MSGRNIKVLLVESDSGSRSLLRSLLEPQADMEVVAECSTFMETLRHLRERTPDLAIIDAHVPELARPGSLEALGLPRIPAVIFTAHHPHALSSVGHSAAERLIKPFNREQVDRALQRAKAHIQRARELARPNEASAPSQGRQHLQRFVVRTGERIFFLPVGEVHWIQSAANYVRLHIAGQAYTVRETMQNVESALDPSRFLRIHRNAIVNLEQVQEFKTEPGGTMHVVLKSGTKLPLSRSYRSAVRSLLRRSM